MIFIWPYCCYKRIKRKLIDSGGILTERVVNLQQTDAVGIKENLLFGEIFFSI
jgi:hypothetical protein